MQSRHTPLYIAVAAVLVLSAVFYYFQRNNKSEFDWTESSWFKDNSYAETNDQPYGTNIAHKLLETYFPGKGLTNLKANVSLELPDSLSDGNNYLFIGEALFLDSMGTDRLLNFVKAGNTALISSKTIPFDLMHYLYFEECENAPWGDYSSDRDTIGWLSLRSPVLADSAVPCHFAIQNQIRPYEWHYLESYVFCENLPHHPLGYLNSTHINFAEFPYGKGKFLLHSTPIAFSNYSLLRPEMQPYIAGVFSHLSPGHIYWDAVSRVPEAVGRRRNGSGGFDNDQEHPLTYILQQPGLAWAWYLLVGLAGLWLLFRAKRRQAIIPVLPKNENSSYEFIGTIANLHFREKNYRSLSEQAMRLFLSQIRERYGLMAPMDQHLNLPRTDDDFFRKLAAVSEIPEAQTRKIFQQYQAVVRYEPSEQMMIDLHLAMEQFLKNAK